MSHMVSKYQLSRGQLKEFFNKHYHFTISMGTVYNKQKIVNHALAASSAELLIAIQESFNANADEMIHYRDKKSN